MSILFTKESFETQIVGSLAKAISIGQFKIPEVRETVANPTGGHNGADLDPDTGGKTRREHNSDKKTGWTSQALQMLPRVGGSVSAFTEEVRMKDALSSSQIVPSATCCLGLSTR
ncbi:MAG: hypothetical protein A4E65_00028 [Syntrophorhabdus sp. PtaU1.Bin153]|nr:MAG: hypothetical protein A4E65_00028 [Syntrophorhabdus sp. PtaU1.Bin153]